MNRITYVCIKLFNKAYQFIDADRERGRTYLVTGSITRHNYQPNINATEKATYKHSTSVLLEFVGGMLVLHDELMVGEEGTSGIP
jgi:hypothetical protein